MTVETGTRREAPEGARRLMAIVLDNTISQEPEKFQRLVGMMTAAALVGQDVTLRCEYMRWPASTGIVNPGRFPVALYADAAPVGTTTQEDAITRMVTALAALEEELKDAATSHRDAGRDGSANRLDDLAELARIGREGGSLVPPVHG